MMPYADALRPFADWYVQLWAESLGKRHDRHGRVVESGPTPLSAVGATDQHAQMQLFMEGPRNKIVTFISVADAPDLPIPATMGDFTYLGGHSLLEVLQAERRGTTLALASDGRPSVTIELPSLNAASLGALFFLYEAATAFAGEIYGIDAFDQPGVELGKRLASGLLGRPGYEEAAEEVREAERKQPRQRIVH
jgi:glucose-6-phosphate isomerase